MSESRKRGLAIDRFIEQTLCELRDEYAPAYAGIAQPEQTLTRPYEQPLILAVRRLPEFGVKDEAIYLLAEILRQYLRTLRSLVDLQAASDSIHVLLSYCVWRKLCGRGGQKGKQLNRIMSTAAQMMRNAQVALTQIPAMLGAHLSNLSGRDGWPNHDDLVFKLQYEELDANNRQFSKRILACLNSKSIEGTAGDDFELEHIFPQAPHEEWRAYGNSKYQHLERMQKSLSNLTLLEAGLQSAAGNRDFPHKKLTYQKSSMQITTELCSWETWNPEVVQSRSELLSEKIAILFPRPKSESEAR